MFLAMVVLVFVFFLAAAQGSEKGGDKNGVVEKKYGHFIITKPAPPAETPASNLGAQPKDMLLQMTYLDDKVVKGAYYTECSWLLKAYPDNPMDLGGELELVIDGESHLITQSCPVFVPKGLKHCPLTNKKVDRPIFMFTSGPSARYENE